MKRNIVISIIVLALIGLTVYQQAANSKTVALPTKYAPEKDALAPAFRLVNIEGDQTFAVDGQRDKPLLINFWASWCGPCKDEAPDLVNLYEKYNDKFDLYAVNATTVDSVRGAEQFVEKYALPFPVLMDADGTVVKQYRVFAYPTNIIVDKNGVIRDVILGIRPPEEIEKKLKRLF